MEGGSESSFREQLYDVLEGRLGAQAMESLRSDTTARSRKKRRMAEGPQAQGAWYRKDLGDALKSLQERPESLSTKRRETEGAIASLLIRHCAHAPRTDFLLSLLPPLQKAGLLDWTSLLELLLATCPPPSPKPLENSGSGKQGGAAGSSKQGGPASSGSQKTPSGGGAPSPRSPTGWAASPRTGPPERLTGGFVAQMQPRAPSPKQKESVDLPAPLLPAFRPALCHVASLALDSQTPLKPLACLSLLRLALAWIHSAMEDPSEESSDEDRNEEGRNRNDGQVAADDADVSTDESVGECAKLIRRLTLGDNHPLPSYNLLDETLVLPDSIPSAEPLLGFIFDIHERRDQVVYYYMRTDCQIRSPTFATLRIPPFTLQGVLGEPLKGPELAAAVPPHSREWERAMACLKQGLRNSVSADWWRRVLVFAPQFHDRPVNPSAEFSSSMLTEALVLRTLELLRPYPDSTGELVDCASWQEWCLFADLLFQIVRSGHVDFLLYLTKLSEQGGPNAPLRSPILAWLFAQLLRLESFLDALKQGPAFVKRQMLELLVRFAEAPPCQLSQAAHVATLLDWAPCFLVSRLSMTHKHVVNVPGAEFVPFPALSAAWQTNLRERIKEGDAWYQAFEAGQLIKDFSALDDVTMGRLWYLSHHRSQETTAYYFRMLTSQGTFEVPGAAPGDPPLAALRETRPMPVSFLTGIAIQSLSRLSNHIEELIAKGQPGASVALMETYVRILLVSPQSLYRQLLESLLNKYKAGDPRMTTSILTILELINYRLLPFYRYHNKLRAVWGDLDRILAALLTVPGQHRLYRLTENLCMSIAPSIHVNFADIKRATKGAPTSETVNRLMVLNIAMVSKTRGLGTIHDMEHVQVAVKQLLLHSTHAWSEATLRFFPPALRELLKNRTDVRGRSVLADWQKVGKAAISAHGQLITAAGDASVAGYLKNVPPEFRRWACVALWALSEGRPENTNTASFARVLRDFTPEEITGNVYNLVDFILLSALRSVQKGEQEAAVLQRTASNLAHVLWVAELLPYDVTLLALADRDDQPQALSLLTLLLERPEILKRVQHYCSQRGPEDHWTREDVPVRPEVKAALGTHYAGHEKTPPLFDDLCLRILPVLPILVGRLVEHGRFDAAAALVTSYKPLLMYHHSKLLLVRDLLAYYHGTMPIKLVNMLLSLLDPQHYAFSETFTGYLKHPTNPESLLAPAHCLHLLAKVAHVLPSMGETLFNRTAQKSLRGGSSSRRGGGNPGGSAPWHLTSVFARHQDCATQGQLLMATVEVELLAVPFSAERIAKGLAAAALRPENLLNMEKTNRLPMAPRHMPGGPSHSPLYRPGITPSAAQFAETCGILLAQLPARFHVGLFEEVQTVVAAAPWFNGTVRGLAGGVGVNPGGLADPGRYQGWPFAAEANNASEEGTVTQTTQALGAVHAFGFAVPFEWLHSLCHVVNMQRPIRNVAQLRFCFKMLGPIVPAMAPSRPLFAKTLGLLFTIFADVCGSASNLSAEEASEVSDLVDFVHHCVTLEGRYMTPGDRTAHMSTLKLCTHAVERLHPELQKMFKHLTLDPERGLFAAELAQRIQ